MDVAYICSPYAGNVKENKQYARDLCRAAIEEGYAPVAPHLYITEVVNDDNPDERKTGLDAAIGILSGCNVIFVGCDKGISAGMEKEINLARLQGKPIYLLSGTLAKKDYTPFGVYEIPATGYKKILISGGKV